MSADHITFTIRPYLTKGRIGRHVATVHAHGFSFTTRKCGRAESAHAEALRAIRQLQVIRGLPESVIRVVVAHGDSVFDVTREFRAVKPKRVRV